MGRDINSGCSARMLPWARIIHRIGFSLSLSWLWQWFWRCFADDDDGNVFDNLFAKTSIIQKNVKFYLQTFFKFDFHCFQIFSLLQGIFFVKAFHEQFTSDILPDSEDDDDADVERWSLINGRLSFRKLGF